ncbi:tryptophan--tRNA ligase [Rhodospirillum centenum]|uniref:Tryptophan--tRNA ligase n=1 Tax=Rhodospirillum centenum (strain ATCC 51521 / SW) TaxID=414684 RepID=B6IVN6_RHOCS|nr:tryptophan--tRNA ligase [Rhodospirillum centenum]ACJ00360.1 tryptophan--tRNA ligase [Rhodospirillum centenum SW]
MTLAVSPLVCGISPPVTAAAVEVAVPGTLDLSHLPRLIHPAVARSRRGRTLVALLPDAPSLPEHALHRFTAALLAFGLAEDARLRVGPADAPALRLPDGADGDDDAGLLAALPLFPEAGAVRAFVASLDDDGRPAGLPKDPDHSVIYRLYARLAEPPRTETLRLRFLSGISWEDAREALAGLILRLTGGAASPFGRYAAEPEALADLLAVGAPRAA